MSESIKTAGLALVRRDRTEVFWTRRPEGRDFLAGFRSYFVGRLHDGDERIPMEPAVAPDAVPEPEFYGCAVRELFEEAGVLPLTDGWVFTWSDEPPVDCPSSWSASAPDGNVGSWEELRGAVERREVQLADVLNEAGLTVDISGIEPVGEWRTPSWTDPGFETEFFLLEVPPEVSSEAAGVLQELGDHVDAEEHREAEWVRPAEALDRWSRAEEFVTTPIRLLLEGVERASRSADFDPDRAHLPSRDEVGPVAREMIEIAGGLRMLPLRTPTLPPATHTNCYLIGSEDVVIVDPGAEAAEGRRLLAEAVERLSEEGLTPRAVLLTHHHRDHVGGVGDLTERFDLPVWAHPQTAEYLEGVRVARHLEDGDILRLGEQTLRCLHTPGHAPGHLCLLETRSGTVLVGDLVASRGTIVIDPPEGHMGDYMASLRRIRELNPRALLPAHGAPITAPDDWLAYYISHRQNRESKVLAALREAGRATAPDLVPTVYDQAPRAVWPLAARSLLAHLIHLEEEGEAVREGEEFVVE